MDATEIDNGNPPQVTEPNGADGDSAPEFDSPVPAGHYQLSDDEYADVQASREKVLTALEKGPSNDLETACGFCHRVVDNPENLNTCPACGATEAQGFVRIEA